MAYQCPHCQYSTPHAKQMKRHKENTGHGKDRSREWKGHNKTGGKKK